MSHIGPSQSSDFVDYYLTARMGLAQALSLEKNDERLARWPLGQVLHVLSQITQMAERGPRGEAAVALAHKLFPAAVAEKASPRLRTGDAVAASPQVTVNLAIRALTKCASDPAEVLADGLVKELGLLVLALGDHLGIDRGDPDSFALEITRLSLFYDLNDLTAWLELAGPLLFEIMPSMTDDPDFVDANAVILNTYGMSLQRFWALTAVQGIAAKESTSIVDLPVRVEGWGVTESELEDWTRAWSSDLASARAAAVEDVRRSTGWSFSAFIDSPITEVTPGRRVAVRPAWVATRATPAGMFWAVRHPYVASGGDHLRWSRFFGRAVERQGHQILQDVVDGGPYFTEVDIADWGAGKQCDAIVPGEATLALDFVYRQFTAETSGYGDFSHLASDLRRAAVKKFLQIDASLERGLEIGAIDASAIYPLVVVGGPFPVNPALYETVCSLLADEGCQVIGKDERCAPLAMMDMAGFLNLAEAHQALGVPSMELLRGWLSSGLRRDSFRQWLTSDCPGWPEARGVSTWSWGKRCLDVVMAASE